MGHFSHHGEARVSVIANQRVWIEDAALEQLRITARLPHVRAAVGLPDLHPGRGYPVGAAFFSTGHFYPALVGGDIGCGMSLWRTDMRAHATSASKLEKRLGCIDGPLPEALMQEAAAELALLPMAQLPATADMLAQSLGTIGGGNHFAELQVVDTVYGEQPGLDARQVHLLVHSGSRGLGGAILREHVDAHGHAGLVQDSPEAQAYLARHDAALAYAVLNRRWIAQRILQALRCKAECLLDVSHNHVLPARVDGEAGFLHRKGATPADQGLVMIPGSRGDYSYLVQPCADRHEALDSLAHGAGRKWARSDCMGRLAHKFRADALRKTRFGSAVICHDKGLLFEEAPQAYKDVDSVVASLVEAGLVQLVARFKPLLTYKKGLAACC
ncbi:RNA ligase RtcB family protein [Comamonas composti]|uniref:RNA ligase RtcB family protein n=1 Tax=Comamonas composti TaxID=408558 RepID=UPI0003F9D108|nr:RNA ligase RtcB family protein [Comamonas composti]